MKVAKIVATCFKAKSVVLKTKLTGDPLGYYFHSQNFTTTKDFINLINLHVELDKSTNPGNDLDLILVNSDVGNIEGNNYINSLNNIKINRGKILSYTRNNKGLSFGAFSDAFKKFRSQYDYFLFTEDDVLIYKENYSKEGIDLLNNNKNNGFVSYVGVTKIKSYHRKFLNLKKSEAYSCHGGIGLSSTKILNKIYNKDDKLPHYDGIDYKKGIMFGEIMFTSNIIKEGYKLVDLPENKTLSIPAYDFMRKIDYKKKPSLIEKSFYYLKRFIYIFFSLSPWLQQKYFRILKLFNANR